MNIRDTLSPKRFRPSLRVPGALVLISVFLVGCFPERDEMRDVSYQLEVYAAAARAYESRMGRWPADPEDLELVLTARPSATLYRIHLGELRPQGDGALLMEFESQPMDAGREGHSSFFQIRGDVEVRRMADEDLPAAQIRWDRRRLGIGSTGTITMQSCALGEYGRDPDDPVPGGSPDS